MNESKSTTIPAKVNAKNIDGSLAYFQKFSNVVGKLRKILQTRT